MTIARTILALAAAGLAATLACHGAAAAENETPPRLKWSFAGPFGLYDEAQLQRGFKVYHDVCQICHSLSLLAFRNLADPGGPGYSAAQAASVAAEYQVTDGPNDQGEMFQRPGRPADYFPPPFPNEQAGRARFGGALPPDLSVIAKARTYERGFPWFIVDMFIQYQEHGVDYIAALLTGYEDPPPGFTLPGITQYNKYFPGHSIGMPNVLNDELVDYPDGTPTKAAQYAKDVAAFLMWVAEPHMEARKRVGFQVMIFLIVLAGLLYFTKKKVWTQVEHHA
jgi:cytochrome c1